MWRENLAICLSIPFPEEINLQTLLTKQVPGSSRGGSDDRASSDKLAISSDLTVVLESSNRAICRRT